MTDEKSKSAGAPQNRKAGGTALAGEVAQFAALADQWWDADGDFAPLHKINPARLTFIRDHLCAAFGRDAKAPAPLSGLRIFDIGCGGGLLCEPLARLGADVAGIDAAERNIEVARLHAEQSGLEIDYQCRLPEEAAANGDSYDVVLNMEVIEHVADPSAFMAASGALVRPGGVMIGATLNRTLKSLALAKIGAEYVLRWVPRGTHDWRAFVKPSEFSALLRAEGFSVEDLQGLRYNPLFDEWTLVRDLDVNYLIFAVKSPGN